MLHIMRNFRVGYHLGQAEIIEEKMKELGIRINRIRPYECEFDGRKFCKLYIDCFEPEEKLLALIDYLKNDFPGIASITY